jgi:hypothetical protein
MSGFDLPRSMAEIAGANEGAAHAHYQQVTCTRDVTGTNFPNGVQQFRFENAGNTYILPGECYFRIRARLSMVNSIIPVVLRPIDVNDDVAPAMGFAAHLYQSGEVRVNGRMVSRVAERFAQCEAFKVRTTYSKSWLDNYGRHTNFWDPKFHVRQQQVCRSGVLYEGPITPDRSRTNVIAPHEIEVNGADAWGVAVLAEFKEDTGVITFSAAPAGVNLLATVDGLLRPGDQIRIATSVYVIKGFNSAAVLTAHATLLEGVGGDIAVGAPVVFGVRFLSSYERNDAPGSNNFEVIWRPESLGWFQSTTRIPPGGSTTIELNPQSATRYQLDALESERKDIPVYSPSAPAVNQVFLEILQVYFYMNTVEGPSVDNIDWFWDLPQMRCQMETLPASATSLVQINFQVPGRTQALALAFQDQAIGASTRWTQSKFKIRKNLILAVPSNTQMIHGQELGINRFYIQYNNDQKPSPDFEGEYKQYQEQVLNTLDNTNFLTQRWIETAMQSGTYYIDSGGESFADWRDRGALYYFRWPKDPRKKDATTVNVSVQFRSAFTDGAAGSSQPFMLMFAEWRQAFLMEHRDGAIVGITPEETT